MTVSDRLDNLLLFVRYYHEKSRCRVCDHSSDVLLGTSCRSRPVDQKPPTKEELVAPKDDKGIETVANAPKVTGKVKEGEKGNVYVLVNPLSNPDRVNNWYVQRAVARSGQSLSCEAQCGDQGGVGKGEYFAIVAVATDKELTVGDMLDGLPDGATCSKLKIVKRKKPFVSAAEIGTGAMERLCWPARTIPRMNG